MHKIEVNIKYRGYFLSGFSLRGNPVTIVRACIFCSASCRVTKPSICIWLTIVVGFKSNAMMEI